jgi:hypothetical protein
MSKAVEKEIQQLAGMVHERRLAAELRKLDDAFARWRRTQIDAFDLAAEIHRFHEGPPRQLWIQFNTNRIPILALHVAEALEDGTLSDWEMTDAAREYVRKGK